MGDSSDVVDAVGTIVVECHRERQRLKRERRVILEQVDNDKRELDKLLDEEEDIRADLVDALDGHQRVKWNVVFQLAWNAFRVSDDYNTLQEKTERRQEQSERLWKRSKRLVDDARDAVKELLKEVEEDEE